jgi:hypothetical protein
MTDLCHYTQHLSVEMEGQTVFCLFVSFCQGWPEIVILPISASHIAWDDSVCHGAQLLAVMGSICLGWPVILPISAFQVARIIGMSHQAWPCSLFMLQTGDSQSEAIEAAEAVSSGNCLENSQAVLQTY